MSNTKANHPYHLVDPSPWPLAGAISALVLAVGAIMYMHEIDGGLVLGVGLLMSLATMAVWWTPYHYCSIRSKIWNGSIYCIRSNVFCCLVLGFF